MKFVAHQLPEATPNLKSQNLWNRDRRQKNSTAEADGFQGSPQTAFYIISQGLLTSEMGVAGRKSLRGTAVTPGHMLKILFI